MTSRARLDDYRSEPETAGFNALVARNIRHVREGRGLSRPALAALAGLKERTIENAESGQWAQSFIVMAKLAAALRQPLGAFAAVNDQ